MRVLQTKLKLPCYCRLMHLISCDHCNMQKACLTSYLEVSHSFVYCSPTEVYLALVVWAVCSLICLILLGLRMDSSVLFRKIISLRLDLHMVTSVNTYAGATKSYSDSSHLSQFSVCKASMHLALCSVRLTTSR